VLEGGAVIRLVVCWPVSWDVVVAVDIGTWNLLGQNVEGPTAKTGGGPAWKIPWLVTVLEAYGGRLAIEATAGPSASKGASEQRRTRGINKAAMTPHAG